MAITFDGQVVVITGAGGGLGRAHALEFARRGARVVVNDIGGAVDGTGGSIEAARKVVAEIEREGGTAVANTASVTDTRAVSGMVKETLERFGRIDVVINNAGILRDKTFAKVALKDFKEVMDVHLMGTVKLTRAIWPHMRGQGYGRVVVTTSSSGLYGHFGQSNYAAAKMALIGLINTLKLEGQKYNIHCNAVAPVAFTRMTEGLWPARADELMTPERVTPAVIYLASREAPTGTIICAGGGVYAKAEILESPGVYLGAEAGPEDIARHWQEISDMKNAEPHASGGEQTGKFFEMAAKTS